MTISNERLREIATTPFNLGSEHRAMATELLAARNQQSAAQVQADALHALITSIIKRHNGPPAIFDFAAWIGGVFARAEKAEADAVAENKNAHALLASLDAARAEAAHSLLKYQDACNDLFDRTRDRDEAVRSAIAARAEVERLRAELADLRAYRDRTEAALVELRRQLATIRAEVGPLGIGWDDNGSVGLAIHAAVDAVEIGLARDAKGEA